MTLNASIRTYSNFNTNDNLMPDLLHPSHSTANIMMPPPLVRGEEVEQIAGRNALPPNIRYELQSLIDQLRTSCRAHGMEVTNINRVHGAETGTLAKDLHRSGRENTTLKSRLLETERENTAFRTTLKQEREIDNLREKLKGDGLQSLYQAGTKFIEEQGKQIKDLRATHLRLIEDYEKLTVTFEMRVRDKDAVVAECQDVQVIANLKAQNAELASTAKAHKMLNDELNKNIMVVQKHFDERKVVMEDQQKLIKRYQKQLKDAD